MIVFLKELLISSLLAASICLILSLVTPNSLPTSSNIHSRPFSSPKRRESTRLSLWVKHFKTSSIASFKPIVSTPTAESSLSGSLSKSSKDVSRFSPTLTFKDSGCSCGFNALWINSKNLGKASIRSSGVGSRPN